GDAGGAAGKDADRLVGIAGWGDRQAARERECDRHTRESARHRARGFPHISSPGAACVIPATSWGKDSKLNLPLTIRHTSAAVRQNRRLSPAGTAPASSAIFMTKLIRTRVTAMTKELIERAHRRHAFADVPLLMLTATLVLSLAVAFTAVSIGIARADTLAPFGGSGSGRLALAMVVGVA